MAPAAADSGPPDDHAHAPTPATTGADARVPLGAAVRSRPFAGDAAHAPPGIDRAHREAVPADGDGVGGVQPVHVDSAVDGGALCGHGFPGHRTLRVETTKDGRGGGAR